MNQVKLSDLYSCHLLKLYYKLYRNSLPSYFDNFIPEYGVYGHNLHNDLIRLPAIRCEFGTMNAKYQWHLRLREMANPSNPHLYPSISINEDTLNKSVHNFSEFVKAEFLNSYTNILLPI